MLRRAAFIASVLTLGLLVQPRVPAQTPSASPDEFVTAIVTLRDQPAAGIGAAVAAEAMITTAADDEISADQQRAIHGHLVLARAAAAQRQAQARVRAAVSALGGTTVYSAQAVSAVAVRIPRAKLDALRARADVASVDVDEPRYAGLGHVAAAMLATSFWSAGFTGGSVDVAVIDTGLYLGHEAFVSKSASVVNAVFHDSAMYRPEYWDEPTDPDDYGGHGTFVSGMVFSQGSAAAPSRVGVANGIDKLFNLKAGYATTSGGGSSLLSDVMRAVDWALVQPDAPEIFNYSYGATIAADDDSYSRYWDAIADGFQKVVTISAGNSGPLDGTIGSPGIAHNVLSVANVASKGTTARSDDVIATSSSRGPTYGGRKKPDLAAPGSAVWLPSNWGPVTWLQVSGTSFSAPAAAAAAALVMHAGVTDPRAVKALLVNSADDLGSAGWDTAYGWGYLNGQRAFEERTSASTASVGAPGTATAVRLYGRQTSTTSKATIAWHRHVTYAIGGSLPSTGTLNNLDLLLYAEQDNSLRTSSASTRDNVEQVISTLFEPAVLAVRSTGTFSGATETFGLAHNGGFVPRSGPSLVVNAAAPGTVEPSTTFTLTATVNNAGDLAAHGVTLTLAVPSGFTLEGGALAQNTGSIASSATASASWTLRAPPVVRPPATFSVSAVSSSYGLSFSASTSGTIITATGCDYVVSTPPLVAPEGDVAAVTVSTSAGCAWSSVSDAPWASLVSGSGTGPGTVQVAVAATSLDAPRTAHIAVADQVVALTQEGAPAPQARKYYLAEGATSSMFSLDVAIANPNGVDAPIEIQFLKDDGTTSSMSQLLGAQRRMTIRVNDLPGLSASAVSTVVTSTAGLPLVVERTMTWDAAGYGGHTGTAVEGPQSTWYFAEGSQGMFDTYVLLANASNASTPATVRFLRESGEPVVKEFTLPPTSRVTVWAGDYPELVNTSFAIVVESGAPIIAERAMYWSTAGTFWVGGHGAAGVPQPATDWFLAEGATGPFFDTYVLLGNPTGNEVHATVTYLLASGETIVRAHRLGPWSRLTIDVETEGDARLLNAAVSTTVSSDAPIVVERALYWGNAAGWYEGHDSFGLTETGLTWGLAEGRSGLAFGYQTYVLIANPSTSEATVDVTFVRESAAPIVKRFTVPATSRFNIDVSSEAPELNGERYGVIVNSVGDVPIVIERAMYWNSAGLLWSGGTNATGVKLR